MKDHEIRELVNQLTNVAKESCGHGCLRERISTLVVASIRSGSAGKADLADEIKSLSQIIIDKTNESNELRRMSHELREEIKLRPMFSG